ncbi:hypothetical protein Agub_g9758 [Astrephomene gubernaculifera]|uniref:NYN domain-containing protein n=1 Tax=Astrephomene gubernaculifera TaxID=47775 RepID=A0AAD3DTP9_9CHLO|nr:hypothetical protein Agub_g9758 [Astrephomene gubernaculifera]
MGCRSSKIAPAQPGNAGGPSGALPHTRAVDVAVPNNNVETVQLRASDADGNGVAVPAVTNRPDIATSASRTSPATGPEPTSEAVNLGNRRELRQPGTLDSSLHRLLTDAAEQLEVHAAAVEANDALPGSVPERITEDEVTPDDDPQQASAEEPTAVPAASVQARAESPSSTSRTRSEGGGDSASDNDEDPAPAAASEEPTAPAAAAEMQPHSSLPSITNNRASKAASSCSSEIQPEPSSGDADTPDAAADTPDAAAETPDAAAETPDAAAETPTAASTSSSSSSPPAPPPPAVPTDERELVLIVWDLENVRLPHSTAEGLSPGDVIGYIKNHYINQFDPPRCEYRTLGAITPASLHQIEAIHPDFVTEAVSQMTLILASKRDKKLDVDVMLKKEINRFVRDHGHQARAHPWRHTIVLIAGDKDYLEPLQGAREEGFNVELLARGDSSTTQVMQSQGTFTPWLEFLRFYSGQQNIQLPYEDDQPAYHARRGGRGGGYGGGGRGGGYGRGGGGGSGRRGGRGYYR